MTVSPLNGLVHTRGVLCRWCSLVACASDAELAITAMAELELPSGDRRPLGELRVLAFV